MELLRVKVDGQWVEVPSIKGEKGNKGDAFTYEDFTEAQKAALVQGPIQTAQNAAVQAVQNKGDEVLAAIPDDYEELQQAMEDTVIVAPTQPQSEDNKLWIKEGGEEEYTIPTYEEFTEVKSAFNELEPRVDSLEINKADVIINTASGSIASFPDGADGLPVKELVVGIEPVQDLHGYDNPWPAGGGKNKAHVIDVSLTDKGVTVVCSEANQTIALTGKATDSGGRTRKLTDLVTLKAGTYVFAVWAVSGTLRGRYCVNNSNNTYIAGNGDTFTISEDTTVYIGANVTIGTEYNEVVHIQIESGSSYTSWVPYSNICPISGWDSVKVTRAGINLWDEEWESGTYDSNGRPTASTSRIRTKNPIRVVGGTAYYVKAQETLGIRYYDKDDNFISTGYITTAYNSVSTAPDNACFLRFTIVNTTEYGNNVSINYPSTDTAYHAYQGNTYPITFPSEAGTVYGGSLTVNKDGTGKLVARRVTYTLDGTEGFGINSAGENSQRFSKTLWALGWEAIDTSEKAEISSQFLVAGAGQGNTSPFGRFYISAYLVFSDTNNVFSNADAFNAWLAAQNANGTPVQVSYNIATPQTYNLTASQVQTILGVNNIWSDAGDVDVSYRADTKLYIDNKITQAIAAALNA